MDSPALLLACSCALLCEACGGQSHAASDAGPDGSSTCVDPDSDGFGVGEGCLGEDCREDDPSVHECDCGADGRAHAIGCPCEAVNPEVCYAGTEGTAGVAGCTSGLRSCRDGRWTACVGEVVDSPEVCDGIDDDCDGEVDEGLLDECGRCGGPDCEFVEYGPAGLPFDTDQGNGVGLSEEGFLTLGESEPPYLVWIPNSVEGTISKFDSRTREEIGRYRTGPLGVSTGMWSGNGDNPSRTGVNRHGDVTVANRAFTGVASVTKILADDCPTWGDGSVDTSSGGDDVREWGEDDCVVWNTSVGESGDLGRSLAVEERAEMDGGIHEYAWMGLYTEQRYYEIDGATGELTGREVSTPGCTPYGAAVDATGILWSACMGAALARFDTETAGDVDLVRLPLGETSYGIDVDLAGDVWTGMERLNRYRPNDDQWDTVDAGAWISGIVDDASGIVWAYGQEEQLVRVDSNDPDLPFEVITAGSGGRGIALDSDGFVWAISWIGGGGGDGYVTILDPADYTNVETTCCDSISSPYAYSDMTGEPRSAGPGGRGSWQAVLPECEEAAITIWERIFLEGDFPEGSRVLLGIRSAETVPELAHAQWVEVGVHPPDESPHDIDDLVEGNALEVRAILEGLPAPVIRRLAVQRTCMTY